jgi:hypothetical protein
MDLLFLVSLRPVYLKHLQSQDLSKAQELSDLDHPHFLQQDAIHVLAQDS